MCECRANWVSFDFDKEGTSSTGVAPKSTRSSYMDTSSSIANQGTTKDQSAQSYLPFFSLAYVSLMKAHSVKQSSLMMESKRPKAHFDQKVVASAMKSHPSIAGEASLAGWCKHCRLEV